MTSVEFQQQYLDVYQMLYGFAVHLTHDHEEAKDLMQETAFRAVRNLHRFENGTNFKAWVSTILYNQFINEYRKRQVRRRVEESYSAGSEEATCEAPSNIMMKELLQILENLPKEYSIPFLMFYRGWHYNEISEHMQLPMGTVKSRIYYARQQMKKRIARCYGKV